MKRLALAALLCLLARSASATTYYVAQNGGSNSNSCAAAQSVGAPKLTITAGVACLSAGDTLFVRTGTYNESLPNNIPSGTSWANKVRIAAYPGAGGGSLETVWMTPNPCGSDAVVIMGNTGTGVFKYIEFDGINMDASACAFYAIKLYALSASDEAHHIRVQNAEIMGLNNAGSCGGITSINCGTLILHASGYAAATGASEFINLTLHRSASSPSTVRTEGFYIQTPDNVIEHCDISNLIGWGIQFWNENVPGSVPANNIARFNKIHDFPAAVGALHIAGIVSGLGNANKIYDNLIYGLLNVSGPGISIYADTNAVVYNNTVYGGANDGIIADGGSTGTVFRNNISYSNSGSNYNNISSTSTTHDHNIDDGTNPVFVNAAAGDFHLQSTSPAIDTGSSAVFAGDNVDYDGNSRPQGSAYDIGAYEYLPASSGGGTGTWVRRSGTAAVSTSLNTHPFTVTLGSTASINDRIIVGINLTRSASATPTVDGVTDSCSNTYALDKSQVYADPGASTGGVAAVYSAPVTTAGACVVSVTWTGDGGAGAAAVAYGGLKTSSPVDVSASNHNDTGTSTAPSSGNTGNTTAANELVLGMFGDDGYSRSYTAGGSATVITGTAVSGALVDIVMTELDSGASGAAKSASGTLNSAAPWAEIAVVYKLAAASAITTTGRLTLLGVGR